MVFIHQFAIFELDLQLIMDDDLSPDGTRFYKSFLEKQNNLKIQYYNQDTKKLTKKKPEDLWNSPNEWRILFEK